MIKRIHCNIDYEIYKKILSVTKNNTGITQSDVVNEALRKFFFEESLTELINNLEELISFTNDIDSDVSDENMFEINNTLSNIYKELKKIVKRY